MTPLGMSGNSVSLEWRRLQTPDGECCSKCDSFRKRLAIDLRVAFDR
jgi:hypothetical protein